MGVPRYSSILFKHTLVRINQILPMEYAIRAIKMSAPDQYQALESIDRRFTEFWRQRGFNDTEIKELEIKDVSWDFLQFGRSYSRQHSQVYHPDVIDMFAEGIKNIDKEIEEDVSKLQLPVAAKNFRYCDLLNGNDILRILVKVQSISKKLDNYEDDESIPVNDFANFIRLPKLACDEYLIFDGAGSKTREGEELDNAIVLIVRTDEPIADFQYMLNDFSWEYGKKRTAYLRDHPEAKRDSLPHKLIQSVLETELLSVPNLKINRHDGFISPLVGLYCWDMIQQSCNWKEIAEELSQKCNIQFNDTTIRRYHEKQKNAIEALIASNSK